MPEQPDAPTPAPLELAPLDLAHTPGLATLVSEAVEVWRSRAGGDRPDGPAWRSFEDAFPTFYEFSNRPR